MSIYNVMTGAGIVKDGASEERANTSAAAIKALTGTNTDGVYWIKPSANVAAQEVYCIMDSTWDGGGWMIVANNAAIDIVYTSAHKPRLTSFSGYVGTNGLNSYTPSYNFSINCKDMYVTKIAWINYTGGNFKNLYTYIYGTFNTPTYIPDTSTAWTRVFDNPSQTLPWITTEIRTICSAATFPDPVANVQSVFGAIALWDGNRGDVSFAANMNYSPVTAAMRNALVSGFPMTTNDNNAYGMNGTFSWADRQLTESAANNLRGWDDFQDGNSLADGWGIFGTANYGRGNASYFMIK